MAEARFQIGILFIVCIAAILSASTLILVAVRNDDSQTQDEHTRPEKGTDPQQFCEQSTDVAIIGAGITGSYAAWRLRHANLSVTLYEYSDRIGGRCHTVKFPDIPDINVELGAMRFHPEMHVMLNKTLSELGLETVDFLPQLSQFQYYLRGTHLTSQNFVSQAPYRLKPKHRQSLEKLRWEIFNNYTNVDSSIDGYLDIKNVLKYTTRDGVPLYKQSVQSFNGKYLYPELSAFLDDTRGFSSSYQDMSAARTIPDADPALPTGPKYNVRTVVKGFQAIPQTMVAQFLNISRRHSFKSNHHLTSIVKLEDGQYGLTFQPTVTNHGVTRDSTSDSVHVCAKTVMLAIPRLALEHLDWYVLKEPTTADYIQNALFEAYAGKLYFAYDSHWWKNTINYSPTVYSTTPLRVTYDFGVSAATNKTVLNVAYNDMYTDIWRDILTQGQLVPGIGEESMRVTDVAQDMARKHLAKIYGTSIDEVPKPNQAIMRVWSEYPIGAAWYRWRQGYHWIYVADHMLKPSDAYNVFIISNTFSATGHQSWTEGGLEIVDNVMKKYFPKFYNLLECVYFKKMSKDRFTFLLDGNVNSFFPGEVVSGQFVAELVNPVIVKEVRIRLFGSSYCEFTETIDDSESTYADQETFVNLAKTCLAGENVELTVGQHKYPFSFTIPAGVPSSFETSQAYVRYQITAVFELAGSGGQRLESCIINVVSPFDLNEVRENLMLPAEYTYEKTNCCLCCKSGPITATIKTDRKGYVPGDTILVNTEISNMSRGRMKESTCKLVMRYCLYAGGSQSFYTVGLGEVKHGPIEMGDTGVYRNDKILIPPCPPSQLHGCKIIKISYVIQLTVIPAGLSGPLIVWTNITIGSIPLDGVALRYGVTIPSLSTESFRDDLMKKIPQVSLQDCTFGGVNIYPGEDPFLQTKRMKAEKQFVPKYLYYKWEQRDPVEMFSVV